jgi:hypothetical protein
MSPEMQKMIDEDIENGHASYTGTPKGKPLTPAELAEQLEAKRKLDRKGAAATQPYVDKGTGVKTDPREKSWPNTVTKEKTKSLPQNPSPAPYSPVKRPTTAKPDSVSVDKPVTTGIFETVGGVPATGLQRAINSNLLKEKSK